MGTSRAFGAVAAVVVATTARLDPRYAENLTLFHINSCVKKLSDGVIPNNMDTSDLYGDVFFDLRSLVMPLECAPGGPEPANETLLNCGNKEDTAADLVVSKLVVEVDSRFGEYGRCNVCTPGGLDPLSHEACDPGAYVCICGSWAASHPCRRPPVGRENVSEVFGAYARFMSWDSYVKAPYEAWANNVYLKTGGMWYSTLDQGRCDDDDDAVVSDVALKRCTWRIAAVEKVVTKACSDRAIFDRVEAADRTACFDACALVGSPRRNTSSACWIGCFFLTVLGPAGMVPHGADVSGGMPLDDLLDAWEAPFNSEDPLRGGCPDARG